MGIPVLCTYSKMLLQEHFEVDKNLEVHVGDHVVLNTRRGMEVGRIVAEPGATKMKRSENTAGEVMRRATMEDKKKREEDLIRVKTSEELKTARRLSEEHGLNMFFHDTESMLDGNKMVFYFTADQRIDFRELVRNMAKELDRKIELRQIGARDVARLVGDVGSCGEELCCKSFLIDFVPVSMKMAKNQGLSLENAKVSGMCGRLKCCLKYEDDLYTMLRKTMPQMGQPVKANNEQGWVCGVNLLTQSVSIVFDTKREELPVTDVEFDPNMKEREIRTWQREMREARAIEREKRDAEKAEREARRSAQRSQSRAATQEAIKNLPEDDTAAGATEGEESGEGNREKRAPREPRRERSEGNQQDGAEGDKTESGRNRNSRSRRGRGRRGPRSEGEGQSQQNAGESQRPPRRERQPRPAGEGQENAASGPTEGGERAPGEGGERRRSRRPRSRGGRSRRGGGGGGEGGAAGGGGESSGGGGGAAPSGGGEG